MKTYKKVLTIAGSDSGGGAGIQADLKTISAIGCFGTSAITAITAQNTKGVIAIHPVPPEMVEKQICAVLDDIGTDAIKIGMLHSSEIIMTVSKTLKKFKACNIVLDPVMIAASGDKLIEDNTIEMLIKHLFPVADIITPNIPEAETILNKAIPTRDKMVEAAHELLSYGSRSVLLKGGHGKGRILYDIYVSKNGENKLKIINNEKIKTNNVHGTGCTLSSAIASFLALGEKMETAVQKAIVYLNGAIKYGKEYQTGYGYGPVNHFYNPQKLE